MSWIKDVKEELRRLSSSRMELRNFGALVGSVFVLLAALGLWRGWRLVPLVLSAAAGISLLLLGFLRPGSLTGIRRLWMGVAFAIGWWVSRIILLLLFFVVLLPVGLIARLTGKQFLDTGFRSGKSSYWVPKSRTKRIQYDKMF